jgi:hypothetical protein
MLEEAADGLRPSPGRGDETLKILLTPYVPS